MTTPKSLPSLEDRAPPHVLPPDERRSTFDRDAELFPPERAPFSVESGALSGDTEVLARTSSDDDVNVPSKVSCAELADVPSDDSFAMALQYLAAVVVDLDASDGFKAEHAAGDHGATSPRKEVGAPSFGFQPFPLRAQRFVFLHVG